MKRAHHRCSPEEYDRRWLANVLSRTVRTESGCLIWQGFKVRNGYGQHSYRGKNGHIHRLVYKVTKGVKLSKWQYACHSCDVRLCVNIDHLWIGTPKDNQQDMSRKGRAGFQSATHCLRGHEFTLENTKRYPSTGRRSCLKCELIRSRERAGWTAEQAASLPKTSHGYRPVGGKFKRGANSAL